MGEGKAKVQKQDGSVKTQTVQTAPVNPQLKESPRPKPLDLTKGKSVSK